MARIEIKPAGGQAKRRQLGAVITPEGHRAHVDRGNCYVARGDTSYVIALNRGSSTASVWIESRTPGEFDLVAELEPDGLAVFCPNHRHHVQNACEVFINADSDDVELYVVQ